MPLSRMTLYIPMGDEKSGHYIDQATAGFAALAGGATTVASQGIYTMANGAACVEPIALVSTLVTAENYGIVRAFVERYAQEVKAGLAQESVLVTIEPAVETLFL